MHPILTLKLVGALDGFQLPRWSESSKQWSTQVCACDKWRTQLNQTIFLPRLIVKVNTTRFLKQCATDCIFMMQGFLCATLQNDTAAPVMRVASSSSLLSSVAVCLSCLAVWARAQINFKRRRKASKEGKGRRARTDYGVAHCLEGTEKTTRNSI